MERVGQKSKKLEKYSPTKGVVVHAQSKLAGNMVPLLDGVEVHRKVVSSTMQRGLQIVSP